MKQTFLVAVCDDDRAVFGTITETAKAAFAQNGAEAEVECYDAPSALEKAMDDRAFDLIFLDIEMPEEDGIRFGERLGRMETAPDIIFVSSREDRVFDAFKIHPFGFVRKSLFLQDIGGVIADYIQARQNEGSRNFVVQTAAGTVTISVESILYFEGARKNQLVYTTQSPEPIVVTLTMKQLEDEFAERAFLRVHTGYLVNARFIRRMTNTDVILTDGTALPISRRKAGQIKLDYMELLKKEGSHIY